MKFETGEILFTRGVYLLIQESKDFCDFVMNALRRHKMADWGDCCEEDIKSNNEALIKGSRLLSTYKGPKKIWILTEYDRSVTTVFFPEEY